MVELLLHWLDVQRLPLFSPPRMARVAAAKVATEASCALARGELHTLVPASLMALAGTADDVALLLRAVLESQLSQPLQSVLWQLLELLQNFGRIRRIRSSLRRAPTTAIKARL